MAKQSIYILNNKSSDEVKQAFIHYMSEKLAHTKTTMGILVYPSVNTEIDVSYVYKNTPHIIRVSTINLNQDWKLIEQRLKEIIEEP